MPAAVGRKIKYRFHAWQAPEVFSKRQPLIFNHYICLCGSFFSSRLCGIYVMCVPISIPAFGHPEGDGRNGLSPPPSRIRYRPTCPRCLSRQPCPGTPSGRCRAKRPFSTTFSNSLWADLPQVSLSPALPGNPIRKVPGETAFLHHLLEFVMGRPAPGVSLASPAREPHPEGAGRNGLSPPPSRIRYRPTCPRCFSRQPYPGCPFERCRRKCRLPVTFLSGV